MSEGDKPAIQRTLMDFGPDDDFILIRSDAKGEVTTVTSLSEDDAIDLLREMADEIEIDGFEPLVQERVN